MLLRIAAEYKKPALVITSLNLLVVTAIGLAWSASGNSLSAGDMSASAADTQPRCGSSQYGRPAPTPMQLKLRAAKVFEKEKAHRTVDYGYLVALASSLRFSQYERIEELLNEYECGRTL